MVLVLERSLHILNLLKEKEGNVSLKDIVFFNEDQSKDKLPPKENLKLVIDNPQQCKRNKTYVAVVVNIKYNLEFCFKAKNDNDTSPNRNKEDLKSTLQKSMMRKEELKSVWNLSLFDDSFK